MASLTSSRRDARPNSSRGAALETAALLAALLVILATQYRGALGIPFINDDFVFLDKVRNASLFSMWRLDHLTFGWYRPWSRELHYWVLGHLGGERELPFHIVSLGLWLGVLVLYYRLVRRVAGTPAAGAAAAGYAAMAAWAVPVLWIAGVQDLWMLLGALISLHAFAAGRPLAAGAAFALALLSKETAAPLPAVVLAYALLIERRSLRQALARVAPMLAVLVAWAVIHPQIGGRMTRPEVAPPTEALDRSRAVSGTLLHLVNLDRWPEPASGWAAAVAMAAPAAMALAAFVVWSCRRRARAAAPKEAAAPARLLGFAAAWAACGWLPLAHAGLGWHAYYALLGDAGAWLGLGVLLARSWPPAAAAVLASTLLRSAHAATSSDDWGTEWYQRRAANFLHTMKGSLLRLRPSPASGSRMYFVSVPSRVGFLTDGAPALRVWYHDPTLSGGFFRDYTPRTPRTRGEDYFFRYTPTGWIEIASGSQAPSVSTGPRWADDVHELATAFAHANDWPRAAVEYERLARAEPHDPERAIDAGVARGMNGDTLAAIAWFEHVAVSPAPETLRTQARELIRELRPRTTAGQAPLRR